MKYRRGSKNSVTLLHLWSEGRSVRVSALKTTAVAPSSAVEAVHTEVGSWEDWIEGLDRVRCLGIVGKVYRKRKENLGGWSTLYMARPGTDQRYAASRRAEQAA